MPFLILTQILKKMKNYTGWQDLPTRQSKQIIKELMEAKEQQMVLLLISDTGLGKSNSIKIFMQKERNHVYKIVVGASYKLHNVVDELMEKMEIEHALKPQQTYQKLKLIAEKLKVISEEGYLPMIIIDEAENLMPAVLRTLKELYDAVFEYTSIVLIGTDQILDNLLNRKHKNRVSVPQLWSRFEAGTRFITPLDKAKDFKLFFDAYIPNEKAVQDLLISKANNYRVFKNMLHPALAKAATMDKPLEEVFRYVNKISSLKKVA
jgi:DNA transposition AAA+ family ATPase